MLYQQLSYFGTKKHHGTYQEDPRGAFINLGWEKSHLYFTFMIQNNSCDAIPIHLMQIDRCRATNVENRVSELLRQNTQLRTSHWMSSHCYVDPATLTPKCLLTLLFWPQEALEGFLHAVNWHLNCVLMTYEWISLEKSIFSQYTLLGQFKSLVNILHFMMKPFSFGHQKSEMMLVSVKIWLNFLTEDLVHWLCDHPHQLLLIVIIAIGRLCVCLCVWPYLKTELNFPYVKFGHSKPYQKDLIFFNNFYVIFASTLSTGSFSYVLPSLVSWQNREPSSWAGVLVGRSNNEER